MDYKTILAEFEERFNDEQDVNIVETETYDGGSAKRKQFLGVSRMGNKWRARIQHPKLKIQVYLGCYSTPEEAAHVLKNKKAEFEEMLKAEDGLSVRSCRAELDKRKLPRGVGRRKYGKLPHGVGRTKSGKFRVRLWHPELKRYASFGNYSICEEAAVVADRKRAELWKLYEEKSRVRGECEDGDEVLQEAESEVASKFECSDEQTRDVKVLTGVSGERVGRIKDLTSNDGIWYGTYDTPEEFMRRYNNQKIAVQMGFDGLNNFEIGDKPNCGVVDVPDKLECEFIHGSRTSNIELGTSDSACDSDKRVSDKMSRRKTTYSLDFDEAVSAGFINEYGQLMGEYCELDEQMCLGLPDED